MILHLPSPVAEQLIAEAQAAHPRECCGFLIGTTSGDDLFARRAVPSDNLAPPDQPDRFELDPGLYLRTQRKLREEGQGDKGQEGEGLAIIGLYHSHPNGTTDPSPRDLAGAAEAEKVWLIIGGKTLAAYWFDGAGFQKMALMID